MWRQGRTPHEQVSLTRRVITTSRSVLFLAALCFVAGESACGSSTSTTDTTFDSGAGDATGHQGMGPMGDAGKDARPRDAGVSSKDSSRDAPQTKSDATEEASLPDAAGDVAPTLDARTCP